MHSLAATTTPNWRGKLISTSNDKAVRRLNRVVSLKSLVKGARANVRDAHNVNREAIEVWCSGHYYMLEPVNAG